MAPKRTALSSLPALALTCFLAIPAFAQDTPAPKAQAPADQRAYKAARALTDPTQKLAALRQFTHDYPKSNRVSRANSTIFTLLLLSGPQHEPEIKAEAKSQVKHAGKGDSRWSKENEVAFDLAEAEPNGIDLPLAEKWAKDSVKHQTEPLFTASLTADYVKYKVPVPKPAEIHDYFAHQHAGSLQTLADVYFHEGKLPEANKTLAEAYALNPKDDAVNSLMGQIAFAQHKDAEALDDFERAQLFGGLKPSLQQQMMTLYRQANNGSDATFLTAQDTRYKQLFPAPFEPTPHKPVPGGHTVLLELFTGSACGPCVGMDLAVEGLLETYPRDEFIALAFDQHIPDPDPLSNPDSIARAALYGIASTPTVVLDGKPLEPSGGPRSTSEKFYKTFVTKLDPLTAAPSPIALKLTADRTPAGLIEAHATVTLPDLKALAEQIAIDPAPAPPKKPAETTATAAKAPESKKKPEKKAAAPPPPPPTPVAAPVVLADPKLTLNFALVEDDIRYPGENGVRFHRMVVRSLAKPSDAAFPIDPSAIATLDATFDLQQIAHTNSDYLTAYAKHNDRFEHVEFLSTDTEIQPTHLAIVAWVQDATTHRVLQSTYVPLTASNLTATTGKP